MLRTSASDSCSSRGPRLGDVPGDLVHDLAPPVTRQVIELDLQVLQVPLDQLVGRGAHHPASLSTK